MSTFRLSRFSTALAVAALATVGVLAGPAGPAAASTGQVQIVSSNEQGLVIGRQTDGTSTFHTETVSTGLYGQPAVTQLGNGDTVIAAVYLPAGPSRGTLYAFWQAAGSTTWNREQVSALAAVLPNQQVEIAAQTPTSTDLTTDVEIVAQNATGTGSTLYSIQLGTSTWQSEAIPTVSGTAQMPYITVDSQNTTVIGYTSSDGFGVDRRKYAATGWETVQDVRPGNVEQGVQAMDEPNGEIIVSGTDSSGAISFFYDKTGDVSD